MLTKKQITERIDAALGKVPCDLVIENVHYLDVFLCEWKTGAVSVFDTQIVGIEPGLKAKRVIDGKGKWLVPGFIDAHVHVESSLLVPSEFEKMVLPKGTTTAICDPHELANVQGVRGIEYFLKNAETLSLDLRINLSSCVPATHLETNGGGHLSVFDLAPLRKYKKALGLAEVMNVPGVLNHAPEMIEKLEAFQDTVIDGHSPLLKGKELSAYLTTGISSCHECSELEEAREKISKGMSVWIREGSVAKDLSTLIPLLNLATSTSLGFCTDDRNPLDILHEGHVDHLVRTAIQMGVPDVLAFKIASLSVAKHYGLKRRGAIAPGWTADFILLEDPKTVSIHTVFKNGVPVSELSFQSSHQIEENSIRATPPTEKELTGPQGSVHVIDVVPGKIITRRFIANANDAGIARLTVLERYGHGSRPANGYVRGFGAGFKGAIASSVGHDSHNLIAVGSNPKSMQTALKALIQIGGGFVVTKEDSVLALLALPFGGLMTHESGTVIEKKLQQLREASREIGCELKEPFLQLAFLSLPVIPSLKLTDKGLVDVEKFQIIDVKA